MTLHSEAPRAQARGEETRDALVQAGLELFGKQGYHGTSSRALAETAGVNQALIGYHFGGKQGLYLAVFELVAAGLNERFGPAKEAVSAMVEGTDPDRESLMAALLAMLDRFVDTFTASETAAWAALIVREQQQPSEAFDVLFERALLPMLELGSRLIGALEGKPADSPEVRLLMITLLGQTLIFRVALASVLRTLAVDQLGAAEIAAIKRRVHQNARAILSQENDS